MNPLIEIRKAFGKYGRIDYRYMLRKAGLADEKIMRWEVPK